MSKLDGCVEAKDVSQVACMRRYPAAAGLCTLAMIVPLQMRPSKLRWRY